MSTGCRCFVPPMMHMTKWSQSCLLMMCQWGRRSRLRGKIHQYQDSNCCHKATMIFMFPTKLLPCNSWRTYVATTYTYNLQHFQCHICVILQSSNHYCLLVAVQVFCRARSTAQSQKENIRENLTRSQNECRWCCSVQISTLHDFQRLSCVQAQVCSC